LLTCCNPYLRTLVITALHTGFRKSELLALRWEHVDFRHRLITVEAAYVGHKTIAMTMRYTHLAPGHKRTAIAVLDRGQEKVPSIFPTGRKRADQRAV
jgi:integrase